MTKKTIIAIFTICILSLFCTINSFAAGENTVNLGNTISETMNKTERSMENVKDNVWNNNTMNNMKQTVDNGINHVENGTKEAKNAIVNTTRWDNNRTDNYNAVRTERATDLTGTTAFGMTTTTWMWIVLAVSAVIIISAVWYYATQNNGRD